MRLREVQQRLRSEGVDALVLWHWEPFFDKNVVYLTGCAEANGILVVTQTDASFFVSRLELAIAQRESGIKVVPTIDPWKDLAVVLKGKSVACNFSSLSVSTFQQLQKIVKGKIHNVVWLKDVRAVKTDDEIVRLRRAARLASQVMNLAVDRVSSQITEVQLAEYINESMEELGVHSSFPTIVASGKNGASPHAVPSHRKLKGFVVLDLGVVYKHYCSDMTRTVFVGRPSLREKQDYALVHDVQEESACLSSNSGQALHALAARRLGADFVHALGHGIGVEVHEAPRISAASKDILLPNMVFTLEPGVYRQKYGIRIEDMFVKKKNLRHLTTSTRELIIV